MIRSDKRRLIVGKQTATSNASKRKLRSWGIWANLGIFNHLQSSDHVFERICCVRPSMRSNEKKHHAEVLRITAQISNAETNVWVASQLPCNLESRCQHPQALLQWRMVSSYVINLWFWPFPLRRTPQSMTYSTLRLDGLAALPELHSATTSALYLFTLTSALLHVDSGIGRNRSKGNRVPQRYLLILSHSHWRQTKTSPSWWVRSGCCFILRGRWYNGLSLLDSLLFETAVLYPLGCCCCCWMAHDNHDTVCTSI